MTTDEKLGAIALKYAGTSYHDGEISFDDCAKMLKEAFELGRVSKKCKEDEDNPYHIDYKRQTKLNL